MRLRGGCPSSRVRMRALRSSYIPCRPPSTRGTRDRSASGWREDGLTQGTRRAAARSNRATLLSHGSGANLAKNGQAREGVSSCSPVDSACFWLRSPSAPAYSRWSSHRSQSRTAARARRRPSAYRPAISRGRGNVVSGFPELRPVNNPGPDRAPVMESSQTLRRAAGSSIDPLETASTCTSESSTSSAPESLCGSGSLPSKPELSSGRRGAMRRTTSRDLRERGPVARSAGCGDDDTNVRTASSAPRWHHFGTTVLSSAHQFADAEPALPLPMSSSRPAPK